MKAVIDRFEGDIAVLLVGERRMDIPRTLLPKAAKEGDWLRIDMKGDQVFRAVIDAEETSNAKQRIEDKLARLRRGDQLK